MPLKIFQFKVYIIIILGLIWPDNAPYLILHQESALPYMPLKMFQFKVYIIIILGLNMIKYDIIKKKFHLQIKKEK
jgi:hypothetical protein